jgi:hypothetical protein
MYGWDGSRMREWNVLDTGRDAGMPGLAVTSGIALAAAGIASATALDVAIDRSGHDHDSVAYRHGSLPTYALAGAGGALLAAGLGAKLLPGTRAFSPTLLKLGAGAIGAWGATFVVRLGVGMLFDPAGRGMHWNPGDIARNSIDRTHMMGRASHAHERVIMSWISQLQGHGSYEQRLARGEFEPMWHEGDPPPA